MSARPLVPFSETPRASPSPEVGGTYSLMLSSLVLLATSAAHEGVSKAAEAAPPTLANYIATALFALAVIHTFMVKRFAALAHRYPEGSIPENLLHFLAETEVVFGLWAAALFAAIAAINGSIGKAVEYVESLNFTEPKFVLVIMVVAATRPVVQLAEKTLVGLARLLPLNQSVAFYLTALSVGPLLGSFVTEPAAMTLLAILLKRRYFDCGISKRLAYATIGLLFVNVSIGGTLTHFAAPPVLMVASTWGYGTMHMLTHFGWKAVISSVVSTLIVTGLFRKELSTIEPAEDQGIAIPSWLTALHVLFLAAVVLFSHHADVFFGVFMLFLGLVTATKEYQDELKLREGLLVGFFLAGLVTLGNLQEYWLRPLITSLGGSALYFGATALTAITDNAALTYLGSLVEGITPELKYALLAGAVTGGGLTVIANAPNPAGAGILHNAKVFENQGISPGGLFLGALMPTAVAIVCFWFLGHPEPDDIDPAAASPPVAIEAPSEM